MVTVELVQVVAAVEILEAETKERVRRAPPLEPGLRGKETAQNAIFLKMRVRREERKRGPIRHIRDKLRRIFEAELQFHRVGRFAGVER